MVRGFFQKKIFVSSVGGSAVYALGKKFPDGIVMGTRGNVGLLARDNKDPLNLWFIGEYKKRFNALPLGPSYQYARSILAYKFAMDKAMKKAGKFPTQDQVIAAMKNIKFKSFTETISMARGGGLSLIHI